MSTEMREACGKLSPVSGNFQNVCTICGKVFTEGSWALFVARDGQGFYVGQNPPTICCDRDVQALLLFNSLEEAGTAAENVKNAFQERDAFILYEV